MKNEEEASPPPLTIGQVFDFDPIVRSRHRAFWIRLDNSGEIAFSGLMCTPPPTGVINVLPFQIALTAVSTCRAAMYDSTGSTFSLQILPSTNRLRVQTLLLDIRGGDQTYRSGSAVERTPASVRQLSVVAVNDSTNCLLALSTRVVCWRVPSARTSSSAPTSLTPHRSIRPHSHRH